MNASATIIGVMRSAFITLILLAGACAALPQSCLEKAWVPAPQSISREMLDRLDEAKARYDRAPNDADAIIWRGRRTAYIGWYKDAIAIFTEGIRKHPRDPRMYRHRGHRFITLRCFDDAIKDLQKAAELIKGRPDEVEPDGLPNARNIPTSTLQSNIWYHLGLAYYLKGEFEKALAAYSQAEKVSKNADMLVATKHWQYMTLRRLGERDKASAAVAGIGANLDIIENQDYYTLIKLYKGMVSGQKLLDDLEAAQDSVSRASLGYGLGNRYLYHDKTDDAVAIFRKIVAGKQWASFGYIAAEADLKRLGKLGK